MTRAYVFIGKIELQGHIFTNLNIFNERTRRTIYTLPKPSDTLILDDYEKRQIIQLANKNGIDRCKVLYRTHPLIEENALPGGSVLHFRDPDIDEMIEVKNLLEGNAFLTDDFEF